MLPRPLAWIHGHSPSLLVIGTGLAVGWFLHWIGFESPRVWVTLVTCTMLALSVLVLRARKPAALEGAALLFLWWAGAGTLAEFGLRFDSFLASALFAVFAFIVVTLVVLYLALTRADWNSSTRTGTFGSVFGAIAIGWIIISLAGWVQDSYQFGTAIPAGESLEKRRAARADLASAWKFEPIAMTLSGGGYRAAIVHAGVLSVLEDAHFPIEYLSTVSGGSIIGGAYALGWSPDEFAARLRNEKPHIADDLMSPQIFLGFLTGIIGTGDAYVNHLARVYFTDHSIAETGPTILLVNATGYWRGDRAIFWKGRPTIEPQLAKIVAASGAFPTVFTPVSIDGEVYLDGGVLENFGLQGLEQYLEPSEPKLQGFEQYLEPSEPKPRLPRVLIISDVSAPNPPDHARKPTIVASVERAFNVSYDARSRDVLNRYLDPPARKSTNSPYNDVLDFIRTQHDVPADRLWPRRRETSKVLVVYLSPSWTFLSENNESSAIEEVRNLGTLTELSSCQVDLGFWVGRRMAIEALPKICGALGVGCPKLPVLPPPHGGTCQNRPKS